MKQIKADFPALQDGLIYLDNASTTQKPQVVIDAMVDYYTNYAANVHRGIYATSERASERFDAVREQVRAFLNAASSAEIIFTSGATAGLNLAVRLVGQTLQPGDVVLVSRYEHHANLIPWQLLARERGVTLRWFEPDSAGELTVDTLVALITPRTKALALTQMSNVNGYVAPIKDLIALAHQHGIEVVVDAAQSASHLAIDVQAMDADFLAFSGHKLLGPTGIGVLYGKRGILETREPVFGGGGMIEDVELEQSTWADLPAKFEPGTPHIAGVIGLGAALDYLMQIGMDTIERHVDELYKLAVMQLSALPGVQLYGINDHTTAMVSFGVDGIHPHDVASILDRSQLAVRAGHHCAQPLHKSWDIPASSRASFYIYNTPDDIIALVAGIKDAQRIFA